MSDLDRKIKESKNVILDSQVNNPTQIYHNVIYKEINKKRKLIKLNPTMFIRFAMIILMIVTISVSSVAIYKTAQRQPIIINPIISGVTGIDGLEIKDQMMKFSSEKQLESFIKNSSYTFESDVDSDVMSPGESGLAGPQGEKGESGVVTDREYITNIQEEKVDEADIVKVNGDYIYYIPYSTYSSYYSDESFKKMYVFKAKGNTIEVVKKINYITEETEIAKEQYASVKQFKISKPMDLFYTDKYLILRLETRMYDQVKYGVKNTSSNYRYYTEYSIYDIDDFSLVKNIAIPGNFVNARLIDNELYIISNYNSMNIDNIYIPKYYINGKVEQASIDDIYYNPILGTCFNSYVVVFKLTLDKKISLDQFYFISSGIKNVYMTEEKLYLLKQSTYTSDYNENKKVRFPITQILILDIKDQIFANGVISVIGNISDQYWIDEYKGYLRVASTGTLYTSKLIANKYEYDKQSEVFNYITIFELDENGKYKEISSIKEGLGEPGETMKSARFEGDTATIVTFKQTDPLYCVDLLNPYNPKITSELKISGFTVYQHPYKDHYIIGIGYETDISGRTTGYKVALFDTSDKGKIKQVGNSIIFSNEDGRYSKLKVLDNPKELFLDLENDIFGFSIMKRENSFTRYAYYDKFFTFKIDLDRDDPIYIFSEYSINSDYHGVIDRMVFIKDKYYLLRSDFVIIYQLNSNELQHLKSVKLY